MKVEDIDNLEIIFKIVENKPDEEQFYIKFCRKNTHLPIDSYPTLLVDYGHLDFTSPEKLIHSIYLVGRFVVKEQLEQEPVLDENQSELVNSTDLSDYVGKVVSINSDEQMSVWTRGVYELWDEIEL